MIEIIKRSISVLNNNNLDESTGISWCSDERKKKLRKIIVTLHRISKLDLPNFKNINDFGIFLMDILKIYEGRKHNLAWLKSLPQLETVKDINSRIDKITYWLQQILLSKLTIGAVFTDIDNTLIHKEKISEGIKIADEERFVSKKTIKIMAKIMQFVPVVLISGRRLRSFKRVTHRIPYTFGIIEHGCVILKKGGIDEGYLEIMRPYIGYSEKDRKEGILWAYERFFQEKGYKTDSEGRLASFRIDPKPNNLTEEQIQKIEKMPHPKGIIATRNLSFLDFIPDIGGKENAIRFILNKTGLSWNHVACMGDDINDMGMLSMAKYPFTLSNAKPEVISIVRNKKGYVSQFSLHKGTEDMLLKIYKIVRTQNG